MAPHSILIVEDEQIVAMDLEAIVRRLGCVVVGTASTGSAAIATAVQLHPDLILMDIRLRGRMDGIAAATEILTGQDVPIIYLTSYSDTATRERAAGTSPYGYLIKPFDERTVQSTIEMALVRHDSDRKLRASEQLFSTTVASIGDAVVTTDSAGQVTYLNPRAADLLNIDQDTCIGQPITTAVTLVDSITRAIHPHPVLHTLATGAPTALQEEITLQRRDGTLVPIEYSVAPICTTQSSPLGAVIIFRDTTARKRIEAEQLEQQRQLEEIKQLERLRILSGGLAHDLNNLFTGVLGFADLALLDLDNAHPSHHAVRQILAITQQATQLSQQLMAYAGGTRTVNQLLDLNEIVTDTVNSLRGAALKDVLISLRLDTNRPALFGDLVQIRQVVLNLVINAAEALTNRQGTITVTTEKHSFTTEGGVPPGVYAVLKVHDTGRGMDEATRQRIFEPFFTTKFTGRGLGLATVLGNIRAHQGVITVASAIGQGTMFTALLPAHTEAAPPQIATPEIANIAGNGTILVIDDEPSVRAACTLFLQRLGYNVVAAANGDAGIVSFDSHAKDLACVLLDLTMPGMSGVAVMEALRTRGSTIPIVLMSGYTKANVVDILAKTSEISFLNKPFTLSILGQHLQDVITSTRATHYQ